MTHVLKDPDVMAMAETPVVRGGGGKVGGTQERRDLSLRLG